MRKTFLQEHTLLSTPKEGLSNSKRRIIQFQKKNYSTPKEGYISVSTSCRYIVGGIFYFLSVAEMMVLCCVCPTLVIVVVVILSRCAVQRHAVSRRFSKTIRIAFRPLYDSAHIQIVVWHFISTNSELCLLWCHTGIVTSGSGNAFLICLYRGLVRTNFGTFVSVDT